ncbi:MAG: hypothetical protein ACRD2N_00480 [Vicinamibacterales bacterium]
MTVVVALGECGSCNVRHRVDQRFRHPHRRAALAHITFNPPDSGERWIGFLTALVGAADRVAGFVMGGSDTGGVMTAVQTAMLAHLPYTTIRDAILT